MVCEGTQLPYGRVREVGVRYSDCDGKLLDLVKMGVG